MPHARTPTALHVGWPISHVWSLLAAVVLLLLAIAVLLADVAWRQQVPDTVVCAAWTATAGAGLLFVQLRAAAWLDRGQQTRADEFRFHLDRMAATLSAQIDGVAAEHRAIIARVDARFEVMVRRIEEHEARVDEHIATGEDRLAELTAAHQQVSAVVQDRVRPAVAGRVVWQERLPDGSAVTQPVTAYSANAQVPPGAVYRAGEVDGEDTLGFAVRTGVRAALDRRNGHAPELPAASAGDELDGDGGAVIPHPTNSKYFELGVDFGRRQERRRRGEDRTGGA